VILTNGGFESFFVSLQGASNSSSDLLPFCATLAPDVWFVFRPQQNGFFTASTCNNGTTTDTTLGLFALVTGSSGGGSTNSTSLTCTGNTLIQLACRDDDLEGCPIDPLSSTIKQEVIQGNTYVVRLGSFDAVPFGYINISFIFEQSNNVTVPVCGDNLCAELESCLSCPQDCCPNDNCATPLAITFSGNSSTLVVTKEGSIQGATVGTESITSLCTSTLEPDVWFYLKPTEKGLLQVNTCHGNTVFDTVISLFLLNTTANATSTGTNSTTVPVNCTNLTELNCNDNAGIGECTANSPQFSSLVQIVEPDNQYLIRLSSIGSQGGHFSIDFLFTPGNFTTTCGDGVCTEPIENCRNCKTDCCPNDSCTSPIQVNLTSSSSNFTFFGSTYNASDDLLTGTLSRCGDLSPDVWFSFNTSTTGELTVSTCSNRTNFDTTLAVYVASGNGTGTIQSDCGTLNLTRCDDDNLLCRQNPLSSQTKFVAESGQNYLIRVGGFSQFTFGDYELTIFGNATSTATTSPSSSPATSSPGTTASGPSTAEIIGSDFQWTPSTVSIKVGDSVHWSWTQGIHNLAQSASSADITALDGGFRNGPCCSTNGEFTHTFDTAGTFFFICENHAALGMKGSIVVEPAGS